MRVAFRTDASGRIGTGHVMRCLALADALRDEGAQCVFICREHPRNMIHAIRQRGHEVQSLPAPAGSLALPGPPAHASWLGAEWRTDADESRQALGDRVVDWLVVDHYAIDHRYEAAMRSCCRRLMVIDDLADRVHDCDLLVDQNRVGGMETRYAGKISTDAAALLGTAYALLQGGYANLRDHARNRHGQVRRLVVYFGGGDTRGMAAKTLLALRTLDLAELQADFVASSDAEAAELDRMAGGVARMRVLFGLTSLADVYLDADLAIGACGTTTWERCCLGLPALAVTVAANQRAIAAEMHRRGCVRWLGEADDVGIDALACAIGEVVRTSLDGAWSARCSSEVDGRGTERVVAAMILGQDSRLVTRLAGWGDEERLLQWANDPVVRRNAFYEGRIEPDEHEAWLRRKLQRPGSSRIYIVESNRGLPLAQARFELEDGRWMIDYSVDSVLRGRGLGARVLETATAQLARDIPGSLRMAGKVKASNAASCRTFEKLGYDCTSLVGGVAEYERTVGTLS